MNLSRRLRAPALAFVVALALAAAGVTAAAVEPPPGSKNFSPPGYVPNYFSNESGPFQGGANTRNVQSETAPIVAAPGSRGRVAAAARHGARLAKAKGRTRLAHGKAAGRKQLAHAAAAHGAKATVKIAHAAVKSAAPKPVAAKNGTASAKGKRIARAHG